MDKKWSWIIVVIIAISLLLYFTGAVKADSNCTDTVCFENEKVSKQIGSYTMIDSNGRYLNSNQWKNSIDLLFNGEGCIYPLEGTQSTFYADWSRGWYWDTKTDIFGYQCYKLKNK